MNITPDNIIIQIGDFAVPQTVVGSWLAMLILTLASILITRRFKPSFQMSPLQNACETTVLFIKQQSEDILRRPVDRFVPFIGTLLLFILISNWTSLLPIPDFMPATSSLSTTVALAIISMSSVVYFGVKAQGAKRYFGKYFKPTLAMLPLNIVSELAGGFSLAVRLYGNIMSGAVLGIIVFMLVPWVFPSLINIYGLIAGTIQPYIFIVLTLVYIASGLPETTEHPRAGGDPLQN